MNAQYLKFFNLEADPFGETPDTRFFFDSPSHRDATLGLFQFIDQGGGFALLTGEVGMGKTLISRILLKSFDRDQSTALILFPKLGDCELLQAICEEFEVPQHSGSLKEHLDCLNEFVLATWSLGRKCVLLIDEAQGLSSQALEAVRLLSNLETEREKLLQIVIVGQPELKARLATPELRQLSQRIGLSVELQPLNVQETENYIKHRLHVAGKSGLVRFDPKAIPLIHHVSNGVPRLINRVCEALLIAACERRVRLVDFAFTKGMLAPQSQGFLAKMFGRKSQDPGAYL